MKQIRINSIKKSPFAQYVLLILFAFWAGYAANEFIAPTQNPQVHQESYKPSTYLKSGASFVCFTPGKKCQIMIIAEINRAKDSIFVQAYSFTDRDIAQALVEANKRGAKVQILLDKNNKNDKRSAKDIIVQNNIPLRFDAPPGIAHNKVMIIDRSIVLTGSYNFSAAAYTRNTENLIILNSTDLAEDYIHNWYKRWDVSKEGVAPHRQSFSR